MKSESISDYIAIQLEIGMQWKVCAFAAITIYTGKIHLFHIIGTGSIFLSYLMPTIHTFFEILTPHITESFFNWYCDQMINSCGFTFTNQIVQVGTRFIEILKIGYVKMYDRWSIYVRKQTSMLFAWEMKKERHKKAISSAWVLWIVEKTFGVWIWARNCSWLILLLCIATYGPSSVVDVCKIVLCGCRAVFVGDLYVMIGLRYCRKCSHF